MMIDYGQFFVNNSNSQPPAFHELTLCQQIIQLQMKGLSLRTIATHLKKKRSEIDDAILAWLREY